MATFNKKCYDELIKHERGTKQKNNWILEQLNTFEFSVIKRIKPI